MYIFIYAMNLYTIIFIFIVVCVAIGLYKYILPLITAYSGGAARVKNLTVNPRSKSEAYAISILEDITGQKFPTQNPPWLKWRGRTLELDGYNGRDIALEFSGPLHTKWNPQYESYDKYFERIVRDVVKRRLAARNHVHLIVLDMSLPRHHWRNYILSRLHDVNIQPRPVTYIPVQKAKPYRNLQLERELNLSGDMLAAKQL